MESLCKHSGFPTSPALRDWQKRTEKNSNIVILRFYDLTTSFLAFGELKYRYHAEVVTHFKLWGRVSSWRLTGKVLHCQVTRQLKSLLTLAFGRFFTEYQWKVIEQTKGIVPSCTKPGSWIRLLAASCTLLFLSLMGSWAAKTVTYLIKNWKGRIISPCPWNCRLKVKWLRWGAFTAWEFRHGSVLMVFEHSLSFARRWVAGTAPWCLLTLLLHNSFAYSGPLCFMQPDEQARNRYCLT